MEVKGLKNQDINYNIISRQLSRFETHHITITINEERATCCTHQRCIIAAVHLIGRSRDTCLRETKTCQRRFESIVLEALPTTTHNNFPCQRQYT